MKNNAKKDILNKSIHLFLEHTYEKTSMRMIALKCHKAVGNVTYYYPKKEDIVMDYHNGVMDVFMSMQKKISHDEWINYFGSEYSFMNFIAEHEPTRNLFKEFINYAALRQSYIDKHNELFINHIHDAIDPRDIYLSTVAMCGMEFQLIDQYEKFRDQWDFVDLMRHVFESRLIFLHYPISDYEDKISEAISHAPKIEAKNVYAYFDE